MYPLSFWQSLSWFSRLNTKFNSNASSYVAKCFKGICDTTYVIVYYLSGKQLSWNWMTNLVMHTSFFWLRSKVLCIVISLFDVNKMFSTLGISNSLWLSNKKKSFAMNNSRLEIESYIKLFICFMIPRLKLVSLWPF